MPGGPGSGNFGHLGRPGQVGGSIPVRGKEDYEPKPRKKKRKAKRKKNQQPVNM